MITFLLVVTSVVFGYAMHDVAQVVKENIVWRDKNDNTKN